MTSLDADPAQFLIDFYDALNHDLIETDEDAAVVIDRYHTPDIVQIADGHAIDREKLIAHTRPIRKNKPTARMDVHEAIATGDQLAARYTLHVNNRKRDLVMDVFLFARFTPDGRMRESHVVTSTR
ncbi:nuclear transport factor 2 family protein [Stackebrandtia nassauensis]|uniref:SnoaL-like domain-containing protein n=1 Tax=Stackebrandtia nassauensis (strain DSM 44728 / CIP 108903 / NRRL B-16338 / NBRC 102104 / LLR-40K-21) TaxID=446470 RepID=D3PUU2_STANL|nr:nuclear transport factor 2 family protein [Stackebrandtia nassauensis]ADD44966.1 hypothetical protein Snas_5332 [Stackebrandtia nassauensis DSM 44728]